MPDQKPGKSRQDYGSPPDLLGAVTQRFGQITIDLAASPENAVCERYITAEENSLTVDWAQFRGLGWLNPPFSKIGPWAKKCFESASPNFRIVMLVPASVGANWFSQHVHGKAIVLGLAPRITFVGETKAYPKDCVAVVYGLGVAGFDVWRWREKRKRVAKIKLVKAEAAE